MSVNVGCLRVPVSTRVGATQTFVQLLLAQLPHNVDGCVDVPHNLTRAANHVTEVFDRVHAAEAVPGVVDHALKLLSLGGSVCMCVCVCVSLCLFLCACVYM